MGKTPTKKYIIRTEDGYASASSALCHNIRRCAKETCAQETCAKRNLGQKKLGPKETWAKRKKAPLSQGLSRQVVIFLVDRL
jgi:hypothetical protein